jgi:predicted AAA+ superfamily ATPase
LALIQELSDTYHLFPIGNGVNLWQSILNDVAHRDDLTDSHLLVLGDRGAGKRSLINSINKQCVKAKNKFIEVEKMGS